MSGAGIVKSNEIDRILNCVRPRWDTEEDMERVLSPSNKIGMISAEGMRGLVHIDSGDASKDLVSDHVERKEAVGSLRDGNS